MDFITEAALLVVLLAISAFFAACEVAFLSISNIRLHSLLENKVPGSENLHRLRDRRRKVIISLLICNSVVTITASALATSIAINKFGEQGLGIAIGVMTLLILTFGEIVPKSFATSYGERFMLLVSPLVEVTYYLTYPLVVMFDVINRIIPGVYSRATVVERFGEDEVRSAVKLGAAHKSITEKERELIENVLEFNDRTVAEAMTPKASVVALRAETMVVTAHKKALDSKYSRFPVIAQDGSVVGTLSVKILGKAFYEHPDWTVGQVAWKPVIFRQNEKASNAFAYLQELGRNIAIVEDEKGKFVGVVTLEDLLEELVGEIK
jgi:putative hemolysin